VDELKDIILFYWQLKNNYPLDRDWRARTVCVTIHYSS